MNELSLFSGYGGFSMGLRLAGLDVRTVGYVEIDEYCQQLIQARIRDGFLDWAPIIRDIKTTDFRPMAGLVDIVTAGFPCQPHSVAGQRRGEADERNLWPDTLRVICQIEPAFVLLENVPGLLSETNRSGYIPSWFDRWRRHNQYLGEAWKAILSDGPSWNERESFTPPEGVSRALWRDGPPLQASDFCLECWMDLVYLWGRGQGDLGENPFKPTVEASPRDVGITIIPLDREPRETYGQAASMDHRSKGTCCCACHDDDGVEQERADGNLGVGEESPHLRPEQYLGYPPDRLPGYAAIVHGQLSEAGYDCIWDCVPAAAVGAPHLRWRWWCLAYATGTRLAEQTSEYNPLEWSQQPNGDGQDGDVADATECGLQGCHESIRDNEATSSRWDSQPARSGTRTEQMAFSEDQGRQGAWWGSGTETAYTRPAHSSWWQTEPDVGRVVDGCPARVDRLRALGNGIVPAVVARFLATQRP